MSNWGFECSKTPPPGCRMLAAAGLGWLVARQIWLPVTTEPTNLPFEFNVCSSCIDRVTLAVPEKLKWESRSDDNMN